VSLAQPFSNFEPEKRAIVPFCSFAANSSICLPPSHLYTMSESESESDWSETSAVVERYADRIRRNDESLVHCAIQDSGSDSVEVLDALKNNTVVKKVYVEFHSAQLNEEALVKLSDVMKCNKSVTTLIIYLERWLLRERFFATMATSGGWSSIQELVLHFEIDLDEAEPLSLREAEQISSFIIPSENLRHLSLDIAGDEAVPIMETLSRTKIKSLNLVFGETYSLQNGGRQLATALEKCSCITDLQLHFEDEVELEFFQILLGESIPKMLGLKKFELHVGLLDQQFHRQFFDMVGQCIGLHQGEIEELALYFTSASVNSSIVGLMPALRRLKVIQFYGHAALTSQQIGELLGIVGDCDALEEFGYNMSDLPESLGGISTDDLKAICQLLSKFPRLKRVTQEAYVEVDLRKEGRLTAFLEMVKTSKTIEQVLPFLCGNAEEEAAIEYHCRNNMIHSRIHDEGLLAANVPASAWPLILREFSDMPDVLYYLLHQKHGAMIGPSRHGCKRKQEFGDLTK
jgi:hypothetical protein